MISKYMYGIGLPILVVGGQFFLLCYNAYHHNFQLLFLTIVTVINTVALAGVIHHQKTKND